MIEYVICPAKDYSGTEAKSGGNSLGFTESPNNCAIRKRERFRFHVEIGSQGIGALKGGTIPRSRYFDYRNLVTPQVTQSIASPVSHRVLEIACTQNPSPVTEARINPELPPS